jgi:hypothetical protein
VRQKRSIRDASNLVSGVDKSEFHDLDVCVVPGVKTDINGRTLRVDPHEVDGYDDRAGCSHTARKIG